MLTTHIRIQIYGCIRSRYACMHRTVPLGGGGKHAAGREAGGLGGWFPSAVCRVGRANKSPGCGGRSCGRRMMDLSAKVYNGGTGEQRGEGQHSALSALIRCRSSSKAAEQQIPPPAASRPPFFFFLPLSSPPSAPPPFTLSFFYPPSALPPAPHTPPF